MSSTRRGYVLGRSTRDPGSRYSIATPMFTGSLARGFASFAVLLVASAQRDCYQSTTPASAFVVRIVDGDATEEGEVATAVVSLREAPTEPVTVHLAVDDPTEARLERTTLVFTPDDWQNARVIDVVGLDDDEADGDQTVRVQATIEGLEPGVVDPADLSFTVQNIDDESASIVLPDRLPRRYDREVGGRHPYAVNLATKPNTSVDVTIDAAIEGGRTLSSQHYWLTSKTERAPVALPLEPTDVGKTLVLTATVTGSDDPRFAALPPTVRRIRITSGDFVHMDVWDSPWCIAGESFAMSIAPIGEPGRDVTIELYASDPTFVPGHAPWQVPITEEGNLGQTFIPCLDPGGTALPRDVRLETRVVRADDEGLYYTPPKVTYMTVLPAFGPAPSQGAFTSDPPAWCRSGCFGDELTVADPDRVVVLGNTSGTAWLEQDLGEEVPLDQVVVYGVVPPPPFVVDSLLKPDWYALPGAPTIECRSSLADTPVRCGELRMQRTGATIAVFEGPATTRYVRVTTDQREALDLELRGIGVRKHP